MKDGYDLIVVGTGFASSFFLLEALDRLKPDARVLVLERGQRRDNAWQIRNRLALPLGSKGAIDNRTPDKEWLFGMGLGGSSSWWWACVPRLLPSDFRMKSAYGVGADWPVSYDDLEPHYARAEEVMSVSGPDDGSPFPRSTKYPQPPHALSTPDRVLKQAFPDQFFVQPTARLREALPGRKACCGNGVCATCPTESKFTIQNGLSRVYEDPRITLKLAAEVQALDVQGGVARGVSWRAEGREESARGELVVLGANALFNPHLLLRSGIDDELVGMGLHEQTAVFADVELDGMKGFDGSTSITGHGYMLYDGPHRAERAAALIETYNVPYLRREPGKWRHRLRLKVVFEELPGAGRVSFDPASPARPVVTAAPTSEYVQRSLQALPSELERITASLPVEQIHLYSQLSRTEANAIGTVRMGSDPASSVVDRHLVHHRLRNLVVLGSSAFPTSSPANPTLTLSALAMWSARHVLSSGTVVGGTR